MKCCIIELRIVKMANGENNGENKEENMIQWLIYWWRNREWIGGWPKENISIERPVIDEMPFPWLFRPRLSYCCQLPVSIRFSHFHRVISTSRLASLNVILLKWIDPWHAISSYLLLLWASFSDIFRSIRFHTQFMDLALFTYF
jgi:hypothetical protein